MPRHMEAARITWVTHSGCWWELRALDGTELGNVWYVNGRYTWAVKGVGGAEGEASSLPLAKHGLGAALGLMRDD